MSGGRLLIGAVGLGFLGYGLYLLWRCVLRRPSGRASGTRRRAERDAGSPHAVPDRQRRARRDPRPHRRPRAHRRDPARSERDRGHRRRPQATARPQLRRHRGRADRDRIRGLRRVLDRAGVGEPKPHDLLTVRASRSPNPDDGTPSRRRRRSRHQSGVAHDAHPRQPRRAECERGEPVLGIVRDQQPELVLLDVQLPDVDGLTVLTAVLAEPEMNVPVILVACSPPTRTSRAGSSTAPSTTW